MSQRIAGDLKLTWVGGRTWRLQAPLWVRENGRTSFAVPAGFVTDLASIPRLPLAFLLFEGDAARAAVVHDWLYATGMVTRAEADALLYRLALADGVPPGKARAIYAAVRAFGGAAWRKHRKRSKLA